MTSFFHRLISAYRVLSTRRLLLIEVFRDKSKRDRVTLWGTMTDKPEQVRILRALADSIERDHQREERERLVNLSKQKN